MAAQSYPSSDPFLSRLARDVDSPGPAGNCCEMQRVSDVGVTMNRPVLSSPRRRWRCAGVAVTLIALPDGAPIHRGGTP